MKKLFYWPILYYLRFLARLQLLKTKPLIIGVTGSVGKTSTLNAIDAVLKDKYTVKISYKANSETGIPLNILGFKPRSYSYIDWLWVIPLALFKLIFNWKKYDIYLVELGVDGPHAPQNMAYLLTIVQPKIGVFLNALPVHSQPFNALISPDTKDKKAKVTDLIAKEKGKLITSLPEDGFAILNAEDHRVLSFKSKTKTKVITFNSKQASLKILSLDKTNKYLKQSFLPALAVSQALGLPLKQAITSLNKNFHLPPGRMTVIPGIKQTTLIDSSYNASRKSMIMALNTLNNLAKTTKKIAVLGDMRELGDEAKIEHQLVARTAAKIADIIVTIGPLMKQYLVPKLLKLKFSKKKIYSLDNTSQAVKVLKSEIIQGQETILIKGSQNTLFLEIIVEALMENPQDADKLLCRRGKFWNKKRQAL